LALPRAGREDTYLSTVSEVDADRTRYLVDSATPKEIEVTLFNSGNKGRPLFGGENMGRLIPVLGIA
jgi:hypothetical protein